jgi:hypothetical protein
MPTITTRRVTRVLFCAVIMALCLPSSGCLVAAVGAGVAAAGAGGYAYYKGAVPRDYPATMDQTWVATQQALGDLGMPILSGVRDHESGTITTQTGAGESVTITLEPRTARVPADGQWTHVEVRVAWFGDGPVSERLLEQIQARLGPPPEAAVPHQPVPVPNQTGPPPLAP